MMCKRSSRLNLASSTKVNWIPSRRETHKNMASRYVGRLESRVLRGKCSSSLYTQHWKQSTRQYATQPSFEGQSSASSSSSSSKSTVQHERDPSLPPKPPPGTYPHPFPNSRDDPHSNSMRLSYQHPPS